MPDIAGARIVVTGGAGFIGSHLVDALLESTVERVIVVDTFFLGKESNLARAQAQYGDRLIVERADAADGDAMARVCRRDRPDLVFNLATKPLLYSFEDPRDAFASSADIAMNWAELLRSRAFTRLVHVSTSEVYGSANSEVMDESHPLLAETSYAAGKGAADLLLTSYWNMFGLDLVIARPFNAYGPRQNAGQFAAVVPLTIKRVLSGEAPVIEGDGLQTRDFSYVADTVSAIIALAMCSEATGRTVNVGSGLETPIGEIVSTIARLLAYAGPTEHAPARPADVRRHRADIALLEALTGAQDRTPLEVGLARTCEWHREPT
jgi:UDP-glucose 4-epimerase